MIRLEESAVLHRKIRRDDMTELATPTWTLVRKSIQAGKTGEALDLLDYDLTTSKAMHDSLISFISGLITRLASGSEEELEKFLRERYYPRMRDWLATTPGVKESLERWMEMTRGHYGNIMVVEEPDKYVVSLDPCGSGGRLRRTSQLSIASKPYPWAWSKIGIPHYCTHCCISWEIIPTELRKYPIKVAFPGDRPEDPCVHVFYKKPELIPEECFTRIGKIKSIK